MLKISKAAPITIGIITAAAGFTCATLGHYAEFWIVSYIVAGGFALFAAIAITVAGE